MSGGICSKHGHYYPAYPGCPDCRSTELANERRKVWEEAARMAEGEMRHWKPNYRAPLRVLVEDFEAKAKE